MYRSPGNNALKRATLHFCGVKPVHVTNLGRMRYLDEAQRKEQLARIRHLGTRETYGALRYGKAFKRAIWRDEKRPLKTS
jgi:hypothetical protein